MYTHKAQFVFTLRGRHHTHGDAHAQASQAAEKMHTPSVHVLLTVKVTQPLCESKTFVMGRQIRRRDGWRGMFVFSTV